MKLNLDYFVEEKEPEINAKQQEIIKNYIQNNTEEQYNEILKIDTSLETIYALSNHRKNIINWYDFKKETSILEVGAHLGEVTGTLCDKVHRVVAIETSKKRAEAIAKRHEKRDNLEIVVGEIKNIQLEETFDYILLYQADMLPYIKPYTRENTIILLATDNRFGITYFAGAKQENHSVYETILSNKSSVFSKNELEEKIRKEGYTKYKFYYPLPNYRMPNVIFSDDYLPDENTTKLMYNIVYTKGSVVTFDELKALKQLTRDKKFPMFANSYLIEIAASEENYLSDIRFISYNNNRKEKYQLVTKMYQDRVVKEAVNEQAINHMEMIKMNTEKLKKLGFHVIDEIKQDQIVSPYMEGETLDKTIIRKIMEGDIEEAYQIIEQWYEEIRKKLAKDKKSKLNENVIFDKKQKYKDLTILKNGYIDLVFENTFYQEGKNLFFDQEWHFYGMPLEFILYRAIQNLYSYNIEIQNHIKKEEMLEKFGLIFHIELFNHIEDYIQTEIIDSKMKKLNQDSLKNLVDANYISILHNEIEDFKANDIKQNEYIQALEEDNRKKQEYIEMLEKMKKVKR